jgi:hypothetical protein
MATYRKCGDTQEETIARVKTADECLMTNFFESVEEGDDLYYPLRSCSGN